MDLSAHLLANDLVQYLRNSTYTWKEATKGYIIQLENAKLSEEVIKSFLQGDASEHERLLKKIVDIKKNNNTIYLDALTILEFTEQYVDDLIQNSRTLANTIIKANITNKQSLEENLNLVVATLPDIIKLK